MKHEARLQEPAEAGYSLRYETRKDSAAYINAPDPELSQQNIDFFHVFEAYNCIKKWFDRRPLSIEHASSWLMRSTPRCSEHIKVILVRSLRRRRREHALL
ncbi:MAG: hypothetical protein WKF78_14920 [Candidatus Limnocylindrales bacterium]